MKKIIGYKGFDKDLKCRGFQYEIGKEYHMDGKIECCRTGFHLCTDPRDVFRYYAPGDQNRFCLVEGSGTFNKANEPEDSKTAVSDIKIIKELSLREMHLVIREYIKEHTTEEASTSGDKSSASTSGNYSSASTSGDYSSASTSGDYSSASTSGDKSSASTSGDKSSASTSGDKSSASTSGICSSASTSGDKSSASTSGICSSASTSGDCSSASTSGDYSSASTSGDYSSASTSGRCSGALAVGTHASATAAAQGVGVAVGYETRARGAVGAWLVLSENHIDDNDEVILDCVRCAKVDGKKLLADTWYMLKNGHFVQVED